MLTERAEQYANNVIRKYDNITFEQHLMEIKLKQAMEKYLMDQLLYGTTEEQKEALLRMSESGK